MQILLKRTPDLEYELHPQPGAVEFYLFQDAIAQVAVKSASLVTSFGVFQIDALKSVDESTEANFFDKHTEVAGNVNIDLVVNFEGSPVAFDAGVVIDAIVQAQRRQIVAKSQAKATSIIRAEASIRFGGIEFITNLGVLHR